MNVVRGLKRTCYLIVASHSRLISGPKTSPQNRVFAGFRYNLQATRSYATGRRKDCNLFGKNFIGERYDGGSDDDTLWSGSEDESDDVTRHKSGRTRLEKEVKKARQQAKDSSDLIDADDSDELSSVWSGSDEEKTLWTGDEGDDNYDGIPTEPHPNETPKYKPEEILIARKHALEYVERKLSKPDAEGEDVWEVINIP